MLVKEAVQCPLCGEPNHCQAGTATKCWCHDIVIPKALLEKIPPEKKGKACVCQKCIEAFKNAR